MTFFSNYELNKWHHPPLPSPLFHFLFYICFVYSSYRFFSFRFPPLHSIPPLNTGMYFMISFITIRHNTPVFHLVANIHTLWYLMSRRYDNIAHRLWLKCKVISVKCQVMCQGSSDSCQAINDKCQAMRAKCHVSDTFRCITFFFK